MECPYCDNTGWVDEKNPRNPWAGASNRFDATEGGPGIPCVVCNDTAHGKVPKMPPNTTDVEGM